MARILCDGNELGDYTAGGWYNGQNASGAINQPGGASTPRGNSGRYYFYLQNQQEIRYTFPIGYTEAYGRFHYYGSGNNGGERSIWKWYQGPTELLRLKVVDAGNPYTYYRLARANDDSTIVSNGAVVSRSWDSWVRIEWYIKMAASGGIFKLWIDDQLAFTFTGSVTGPAGQNNFDTVALTQTNNSNGTPNSYDDVAINDPNSGTINTGRCGEGWSVSLYPKGNGSVSQLVNNYGTNTNNFQNVQGLPGGNPNGFTGTNTAGQLDRYKFDVVPNEFIGVNVFKVGAYVVKNGPAISHAQLVTQHGAEPVILFPALPGAVIPSGGFAWINQILDGDPNEANPFTIKEINDDEVGIKFLV